MNRKHRERVENFVGDNALGLFFTALTLSGAIEILQIWPEFFPAGHEIGEIARNLGYGIAAAFAFNWIMVEVPRKREARRILDAHWDNISYMAKAGGVLIAEYRQSAPEGDYDTQTEKGMKEFLGKIPLIQSWAPETVIVRDGKTGEKFLQSDPFARTATISSVAEAGRIVSPYIHRLEPKVRDAIIELTQFPDWVMNGLMPISTPSKTLDAEFNRIWAFVSASRKVRVALEKHYPHKEINKKDHYLWPSSPDRPWEPILEADF